MNAESVLKLLACLALWSIVGYLLLYVDPQVVRNVLWEDSYLPFYVFFGLASLYTVVAITDSIVVGFVAMILAVSQFALMQMRVDPGARLVLIILGCSLLWWLIRLKNGKVGVNDNGK